MDAAIVPLLWTFSRRLDLSAPPVLEARVKHWGHLIGGTQRGIDDEDELTAIGARIVRSLEGLFDPPVRHPPPNAHPTLQIELLLERDFVVHRFELEVEPHV